MISDVVLNERTLLQADFFRRHPSLCLQSPPPFLCSCTLVSLILPRPYILCIVLYYKVGLLSRLGMRIFVSALIRKCIWPCCHLLLRHKIYRVQQN